MDMDMDNRRRNILITIFAGLASGYLLASIIPVLDTNASQPLKTDFSEKPGNQINQNTTNISNSTVSNVNVSFGEGFYGQEPIGRWMSDEGEITIESQEISAGLIFNITLVNGYHTLSFEKNGEVVHEVSVNSEQRSKNKIRFSTELEKGENSIIVKTQEGCSKPSNHDDRCLSIALGGVEVMQLRD